ncbi:MAG: hypothetical protein LUQ11_15120 [Methylococcaceae bacterium]|nr:hypothetical protein [Methylococcaceae bacterium]
MQTLETTVRQALPSDAASIAALYMQLVSNPAVTVLPERIAESKYPPAKPGALCCEPLKAVKRVANAALKY